MNEEELRAKVVELEEKLKELASENENFKNAISEKDERINSLQEHNQKLFMKVTTPIVTEENKEKTQDEKLEDLCSEILKLKRI